MISDAVAHWTVAQIVSRDFKKYDLAEWNRFPRGSNSDKAVLIVGYGHIGKAVNHYLGYLYQKIEIYDRLQVRDPLSLENADIVTFHVPSYFYYPGSLLVDNKGMINADLLNTANPMITIINSSRGDLVNEQDMADFLKENPKATYIADVWGSEPYVDGPLKPFIGTQVFGTPHIASHSVPVLAAHDEDINNLIEELDEVPAVEG